MGLEEEQKLVEQAKTDAQAFSAVFDMYYSKISNYVLRRVGDLSSAQDITSIVFFKAWRGLPEFEWRGLPFGAWLYRIASNEVNTHFRQNKHAPSSLDELFEETGFELPSSQDLEKDQLKLEDELDRHADFVLVQALLKELPIKYQEVLTLRFFEKKPIKDIADIIGKKENTVKSLLARGTTKLQRNFLNRKTL
ncbi:MAG TPA: sigma-70 family RNA polymerase sigma factor [Patescibacteria group bacterium]|jgi:RNA polymerase sigma-70 factor (ECF subfamily)|nr:sigma-70 family RNA polymerase sigma factor [Patescibacteria group bacterium]